MAIKPMCEKCRQELQDYGGILFSPPDIEKKVKKFHLCVKCYKKIESEIKSQ